ncbi:TetR/AcrR family transcriptional regulator [Actinophytocola gossypii]|uniref:TetR/AcrR family transcriptional regulator n=1 Tax=Actinophytocola gossypii TaxID=2812003 RepID=A0ABT2JHZ6_9PSEU|nr:TetR/AcrR family transcriptional regulator [Actinophytocola gossypii]MCT2587503.1 TetR/AcrR family transcriptional regulator [Actinophytocola gossypii]
MSTTPAQPVTRPGGRTARTRAAVRDATLAELAAHGHRGLTVEGVAERSGVHKTTVYRRWGGVDGLIVDALDLAADDDWQPADTGTFAGDCRALADAVRRSFADRTEGAASTAIVAAAFQSTRAADALRKFYADRHQRSEVVVDRAVARGELPAETDAAAIVRAVVAPLYHRLFVTREPIDERVTEHAAAAAVAAALAGVFAQT